MIDATPRTDIKTCNRCREQLPKSAFNPNPHFRDGLHGQCRDCQEKTRVECDALVAERDRKLKEKAEGRSREELEQLRQRNLQYRRTYLMKKKARQDSLPEGLMSSIVAGAPSEDSFPQGVGAGELSPRGVEERSARRDSNAPSPFQGEGWAGVAVDSDPSKTERP